MIQFLTTFATAILKAKDPRQCSYRKRIYLKDLNS